MPVVDLKVSLRKRGATDFASDGARLMPITKKEYVQGLLGPDGKIDPSIIPAWLWAGRQPAGVIDLVDEAQGGTDIYNVFIDAYAFGFTLPMTDYANQGLYVEVTTPGQLKNASANAAKFELIGAGNEGDRTFPLNLSTGDYIVLVKLSTSPELYSIAIVDNTYGDATTTNKGIVQLYDGVDSASSSLAATANAVKTAYDLAYSREPAFTKNSAFNKNFGGTGSATTVARSDHYHSTYDRATAGLTGANVFSDIVVADGIVTGISTRALTLANLGFTGDANANYYVHPTFSPSNVDTAGAQVIDTITFNNGHVTGVTLRGLAPSDIGTGAIDDGVDAADVVWSGAYLTDEFGAMATEIASARTLAKKGLEYYASVALADAGGHAAGDIVAVLEA